MKKIVSCTLLGALLVFLFRPESENSASARENSTGSKSTLEKRKPQQISDIDKEVRAAKGMTAFAKSEQTTRPTLTAMEDRLQSFLGHTKKNEVILACDAIADLQIPFDQNNYAVIINEMIRDSRLSVNEINFDPYYEPQVELEWTGVTYIYLVREE